MKRERNLCLKCDACYKPLQDGISATAGGWEEKEIDGKRVLCCRPGEACNGKKRTMGRFDYYCLAKLPAGKKISKGADYTGLTPKWCPRLGENKNDK